MTFVPTHTSPPTIRRVRIYKNKTGVDYGEKGARSSQQLIREVGPPLEAIGVPLPVKYSKGGKHKWVTIDDQWGLPDASITCGPLNKAAFANDAGKSKFGPWEAGSRILNAVLRHSNTISYQRGGWVKCEAALQVVRDGLSKTYDALTVERIASVHWLFGLVHDKDKTLKSRFQLAGVVNKDGILIEICYVRCKSGHSEKVAKLIPNDTIYTRITSEHLKYISCISHKTRFENIKNIFSMGLIPGGERSRNNRAHSNFSPFPPFDNRNLAPGRLAGEYNVVIIFNPEKLINHDLRLSMNAILVTDSNLPWTTIDLVYVVPPINSGKSWVLYNPDLIGRKIMGHTAPSHGKYADACPSDQDIPQSLGDLDCGWSECPCCKSLNPEGFTACLNCRVKFSFEPIAEVSKVARRTVGKSENAGSTPASSNPKAVAMVPTEVAAKEAIRIAKLQAREDNNLEQRYLRPGDHLWEVVNANMKWRIRFDGMTDDEQQEFIASGKSRFCAGEKFEKRLRSGRIRYGGAAEYLKMQSKVMSDIGRDENETSWILHQKIYIVGVLVDMIEAKYPWSTESRGNLIWFKQRTGRTREFLNMWHDELGDLLEQQKISLHELMSAEMLNERNRRENRVKIAEIMRKSEAEITAEDMKIIEARIASREIPSSSSSRPHLGKGTKVEDDANKGPPKAAPAVARKISKAPPAQPPNRDTPPIDPPAKRAKGVSKGAAERAASGSRPGKGKGNWGGKGKSKNGPPEWYRPPERQDFEHLPTPPPFNGPSLDGPFDGERRLPIRRKNYEDVRELDRRRRERAIEPPNDAYREWHDAAWVGQSLAPPADDRDYRGGVDYRAESRSRSSGWHPSLYPPSNMDGRRRTRSPARRHPNNRGPRIYHDGNMEWEIVDDDWWDRQNQRHQDRLNEEYQRERRG